MSRDPEGRSTDDRKQPVVPPSGPGRRIGPYEQSLIESRDRIEREDAHRRAAGRRRRILLAVGGAVVVVALVVGGLFVFKGGPFASPAAAPAVNTAAKPRSCAQPPTITIATPAALAPALSAVTHALAGHDDAPCAAFALQPGDPAAVAATLGGKQQPAAWVTDSPRWVEVANTTAGTSLQPGTPFASSALVVAMPPVTAESLGEAPTWADVFGPKGGARVEAPTRSTTGLLGLAAAKQSLPPNDFAAVLTSRAKEAAAPGLAQVAQAKVPFGLVVTEADLITYNVDHAGAPLAAVAPKGGAPAVEYALTTVAADQKTAALVEALGSYLATKEAQSILAEHGLRTPGADEPKSPEPLHGTVAVTPAPDAATLKGITDAWSAAVPKRQVLLALDVSGSVLDRIGDATGLAGMTRAANGALATAPDSLRIALWAHGLHIGDRGDDFKRITGYGPVSDPKQAKSVTAGLDGLSKLVGGGSGLYDSILAAYTSAVGSFAAGYDNTVVVVADGPNEDDYGIDLAGLKSKLQQAQNAKKPVKLVVIGFGSRPDAAALKAVAAITKGSYVAAPGPAELASALESALGAR